MKKMTILVAALAIMFGMNQLAAAQDVKPAQVAGMWKMAWEGRNGMMEVTLTLEQDGEKAKGTMSGGMGGDVEIEATITGKKIVFATERETPRGTMSIEYTGEVDGDAMKGTFGMGQFTRDWTATRVTEKEKK